MGMRDELVADIAEELNGDLQDAVSEFEGIRISESLFGGQPNYDDWLNQTPDTDTSTKVLTYTGQGVFDSYNAYEIDKGTIKAVDINLICLQDKVTDTPEIDDKINGYTVISVSQDALKATYDIQLRKV